MSYIKYRGKGKYETCGCGGAPVQGVELPADSVPFVYDDTRTSRYINGPVTGARYLVQPDRAMIDVDVKDADAWEKSHKGHVPGETELFARNVYKARQ